MNAARALLHRRLPLVTAVCSILFIAAGSALLAGDVASAVKPGNDVASRLVVTSTPDPAEWTEVEAGGVIDWRIRVGLKGAPSGALTLKLSGQGPLLDQGLRIAVQACELAGVRGGCQQPARPILATPVSTGVAGQSWRLGRLDASHPVDLFVTLAVPDTAQVTEERTIVGIGVFATGEAPTDESVTDETSTDESVTGETPTDESVTDDRTEPPGPDKPLAETGLDVLGPLLLGLGLVGLGGAASLARRRRSA